MSFRRTSAAFLAALLTTACATTPRVVVDRIPDMSLVRYQSFAFHPGLEEASDDPAFGPSAREAAHEQIGQVLSAHGLEQVEPAQADLLVAVRSSLRRRGEPRTLVAVAPGYDVWTYRTSLVTPVASLPLQRGAAMVESSQWFVESASPAPATRTLMVEMFDATSGQLVWRGTSRMRASRRMDLASLREHVRATVARFPGD